MSDVDEKLMAESAIMALVQKNSALISALRECVVALDEIVGIHAMIVNNCNCVYCRGVVAKDHAKSTLERYGEK